MDEDTGSRLEEYVNIADVRPAQKESQPPEALGTFAVGDHVDIWANDLWWEGRVVQTNRGRNVTVISTRARSTHLFASCDRAAQLFASGATAPPAVCDS